MKIKKIEKKEKRLTMDIEVDKPNSYLLHLEGSKGLISHNSLKGILQKMDDKERPSLIERNEAPERPKDLPCDIHKSTTEGDDYVILVGILNGAVYEVFAGKLNGHDNIIKYKKGIIRKEKRGLYDLILLNNKGEEKDKVSNLQKTFTTKNYNTVARLISMALRHGTPLEFVSEQLKKDKNFLSFESSLARVIRKYIKDGELVRSSMDCDACGGRSFIFESGCYKCADCGGSKCE